MEYIDWCDKYINNENIQAFVTDITWNFLYDFFGETNLIFFNIENMISNSIPEFKIFMYRMHNIFLTGNFINEWSNTDPDIKKKDILAQTMRYGDGNFFKHYPILCKFGNDTYGFKFESCTKDQCYEINYEYNVKLINYLVDMIKK